MSTHSSGGGRRHHRTLTTPEQQQQELIARMNSPELVEEPPEAKPRRKEHATLQCATAPEVVARSVPPMVTVAAPGEDTSKRSDQPRRILHVQSSEDIPPEATGDIEG